MKQRWPSKTVLLPFIMISVRKARHFTGNLFEKLKGNINKAVFSVLSSSAHCGSLVGTGLLICQLDFVWITARSLGPELLRGLLHDGVISGVLDRFVLHGDVRVLSRHGRHGHGRRGSIARHGSSAHLPSTPLERAEEA